MNRSYRKLAPITDAPSSALERELVNARHRLFNERHGCGPSLISFEVDDRGRLVCTMGELLTPEEQEKVDGGDGEELRNRRLMVRHADTELIDAIEGITGRKVRAVATSVDPERDVATEVFELWGGLSGPHRV
jgi:uncharacterized protein YbcI